MTRRAFIKGLLGVILAGLFTSIYAFFIEPSLRLKIQNWRIRPKRWDRKKLKIAIISDLHLSEPQMGLGRLSKIVARTNAIGADLIVLLGDYPAHHRFISSSVTMESAAEILAKLDAPLGVFSILGNHDWWDDPIAQKNLRGPTKIGQSLQRVGITVLENDVVKLEYDDQHIWLAGLGDQLAFRTKDRGVVGVDDLPGTLAQIPDDGAPAVLLAHEPDIFPKVPDRICLTLSGHTHGGQIRLFGYSPIVPSQFGNEFSYGHVVERGRDLVVSGGLGCSMLPIRFGVVPEITVVELS